MIYDLTEKRPKESLVVIPWESNSKTFPIILKELKKYKWAKFDKAYIYRWWKKEEKKEEFEKYGDVAVMEEFNGLGARDDDALIVLHGDPQEENGVHIYIGPCEAQLRDCFVIDKKKKCCFYDDMDNLKMSYNFKERKKNGTD